MPTDSFSTTAGALTGLALATGKTKLAAGIATVAGIASLTRKISAGLTGGSEPPLGHIPSEAGWSDAGTDWRVKLSLPVSTPFESEDNPIIAPLKEAGALIFPFTPQINFTHSANYNTLDTVHSNYPFLAYEHSKVEQITITADFYCENSVDAAYWMAAVHFLRSVTKMSYGGTSSDAGQPPPVIKLSGYGAYVFNNVPVVVKSFSMDMPKDVDYIGTPIANGTGAENLTTGKLFGADLTYAPTKSTFNIVLMPIYSRTQVRNFSLDSFVKGDYVLGVDGSGFI